jgi:predicted RNase H-like HicB family nuclease
MGCLLEEEDEGWLANVPFLLEVEAVGQTVQPDGS